MSLTTIPVTCIATDDGGVPVAGAVFVLALNITEVDGQLVAPEPVTGIGDETGTCVVDLWPNEAGLLGSVYVVTVTNPVTGRYSFRGYARFPEQVDEETIYLHDYLVDPAEGGFAPPTSALIEAHNADPDAHPAIRALIPLVTDDLQEGPDALNRWFSELAVLNTPTAAPEFPLPTDPVVQGTYMGAAVFQLQGQIDAQAEVGSTQGDAITNIYAILNYVEPAITSYEINGAASATIERGASLTDPVLTWTLDGSAPETQSIDNGVGIVPVGTLTKTVTGTFTTAQTWNLTVDGTSPAGNPNSDTLGVSLNVRQKRYWGASVETSLDNAEVLALSSEFATSRGKSVTFDCTGGRYVYYAYPASFGLPTVKVGGLDFTAWTKTDLSFTNASGYTEAYYVIRFDNLQNGAAIQVVFA